MKLKIRNTLLCCLTCLFAFAGRAQESSVLRTDNYKDILRYIDENSPLLQVSRIETQAEIKGNHTGLVPDNPEFGFGYLVDNEKGAMNRMDFEVSQSFDFPSVYVYKTRAAKLSDSAALYRSAHERALLLMEAENLCIELVYINALLKFSFEDRMRTARELSQSTQEQLDMGHASVLERNKANLNLLQMEKDLAVLKARKAEIEAILRRFTGDCPVVLDQDRFYEINLPESFDAFFAETAEQNPLLLQARSERGAAQQNVRANVSEALPSFSVGYVGEDVFRESRFHGLTVGLSVPLWENKNRVKQAKLEVQAAQKREEDSRLQLKSRLETLYHKASELYPVVMRYRQSIEELNNLPLLEKALESGEFSLLFYIDELQSQFDMIDNYLQAEMELALTWSELQWLSSPPLSPGDFR